MSKKRNKTFNVSNPQKDVEQLQNNLSKYKLGDKGLNFYDIKKLKPVFAFDYLSLNGSVLCFNEKSRDKKDLLGFLKGLKKISSFTYDEISRNKTLRFHKIDFDEPKVSIKAKDFLNVLAPSGKGITEDELPTLYQFDLQYRIEARAVGFLFKGVFYIVWYDREHKIYPKNR